MPLHTHIHHILYMIIQMKSRLYREKYITDYSVFLEEINKQEFIGLCYAQQLGISKEEWGIKGGLCPHPFRYALIDDFSIHTNLKFLAGIKNSVISSLREIFKNARRSLATTIPLFSFLIPH